MAYRALYREWRPQSFDDMIGQEGVKKTIKNQIIMGRVPHAYLFCGTRGTGKTTTAKILAKAVNCPEALDGEPCNSCEICREINNGSNMDVVEIDAASNTGVENIRRLIDDVKYPPHSARYKIYIIDEVHMLSLSAFNALLKTLEEPPSYVIFILATTDPQKVPATILSRCQRFDFKRINTADIAGRLRTIADENSVEVEDRTLQVIAKISDGAMRDAISIFDQAISVSEGKVEYTDVTNMLGLTSGEYIFRLVDSMIDKNVDESMNIIDETILNGKDVGQFVKDILKHFRNLLMIKVSKKPEDILDLSEDYIIKLKDQARKVRSEEIMRAINLMLEAEGSIKFSSQQRIVVELAVVKFCRREYDSSPEMLLNRLNKLEEALKNGLAVPAQQAASADKQKTLRKPAAKAQEKAPEPQEQEQSQDKEISYEPISIEQVKTCWQEVINLIKSDQKVTVGVCLSLGIIVGVEGNKIIIGFDKDKSFSKTRLEEPDNKKIVERCFTRVLNKKARVEFKINAQDESFQQGGGENPIDVIGSDVLEVIEE